MLIILPLFQFICTFVAIQVISNDRACWRTSFILTAVIWGVLLTGVTELLSIFKLLTAEALVVCWALFVLPPLYLVLQSKRPILWPERSFGPVELTLVAAIVAILAAIGIIAWLAPPNTWDSMTYHMSRVMHWAQNRSVAHYPTHILRQLHQAPWSEYVILHLRLLSGTDHYSNFVQWYSMVGSAIGVSLITKRLGGDVRAQIIAALFMSTIPMGILQGSSTQTDHVVSFWLVCFTCFVLEFDKGPSSSKILMGGSLGLALLAKATAYIFAAPFVVWFGARAIAKRQPYHLLMLIVALTLNLGLYWRNVDLYGNPLGPGEELPNGVYKYTNDEISFPGMISNAIRNAALHMGTYPEINAALEQTMVAAYDLLGISISDPKTTWSGTAFHIPPIKFDEYSDGNLVHFLLIGFCALVFVSGRDRDRKTGFYLASLIAGFLLFCLLLKWQMWNSRLHLPLFILASPIVGLTLAALRTQRLVYVVTFLLIMGSLPYILWNRSRPILMPGNLLNTPRFQQYFFPRPDLFKAYSRVGRLVSAETCQEIGLILGIDSWEYPLWVALQQEVSPSIHIQHVNVTNISRNQPEDGSTPCLIITDRDLSEEVRVDGQDYQRFWRSSVLYMYRRK
jgi:hypothetical protein